MEKRRGCGYKLLLARFHLHTTGNFFTISHWNNLSRKVVDYLTLDAFKIWLDKLLGHLVYAVLFLRKFGL